ncbi:MAG: molybdopterin molybdenumtransferase MoeA, partial [Verrucomicrobiales bacterium]|nr:molybdopterin molybdenumtransferase MoeA [Verrucomicrobiales bacterium]
MLSLEEAQTRILAQVETLGSESVPLSAAAGRYLLVPPAAQADLPGFDNSAMDGYAVRSEDLKSARSDSPVTLQIIGKIAAGQSPEQLILSAGACCRVFTGSMLPNGADAVLMQEDTRPGKLETVECFDSTRPLEHIRLKGEDVRKGALLLSPGERLSAGKLSLGASAGIVTLKCGRQP